MLTRRKLFAALALVPSAAVAQVVTPPQALMPIFPTCPNCGALFERPPGDVIGNHAWYVLECTWCERNKLAHHATYRVRFFKPIE